MTLYIQNLYKLLTVKDGKYEPR